MFKASQTVPLDWHYIEIKSAPVIGTRMGIENMFFEPQHSSTEIKTCAKETEMKTRETKNEHMF